jgi:hypothetical protein
MPSALWRDESGELTAASFAKPKPPQQDRRDKTADRAAGAARVAASGPPMA